MPPGSMNFPFASRSFGSSQLPSQPIRSAPFITINAPNRPNATADGPVLGFGMPPISRHEPLANRWEMRPSAVVMRTR